MNNGNISYIEQRSGMMKAFKEFDKKKSNIQFMTLLIEWYSKQEQNVNLINFWKYRLNKNLENEKISKDYSKTFLTY